MCIRDRHIGGAYAVAVVNANPVAGGIAVGCQGHGAAGGGEDGCAGICRNINPLVVCGADTARGFPGAEVGGNGGAVHRPDQGDRRGCLLYTSSGIRW